MGESTLSLSLEDLRREVAYFLGKGRDEETWSDEDIALFDAHICAGLRMFYNPVGHSWSFFKPFTSLDLELGKDKYNMPDDFGYIIGNPIVTEESTGRNWHLQRVSVRMLSSNNFDSGVPLYYALEEQRMTGDNGTRYKLLLSPCPDGAYKLTMQYSISPDMISENKPYPYGGMQHAETIREAVLAKAEEDSEDTSAVHANAYQERLAASIEYDVNMSTADVLGYNGNTDVFARRVIDNRAGRMGFSVNGRPITGGSSQGGTQSGSGAVWINH